MDLFFNGRDKESRGSLYNIKQKFRLKTVNRSVMNNFAHVEELVELSTQGLIALW